MKNREQYIREVENRLSTMFRASRDGYESPPADKHRLQGFIQAGTFLGLTTREEMQSLMARIHLDVFGKTIAERKSEKGVSWMSENVDYGKYDQPTYERTKRE